MVMVQNQALNLFLVQPAEAKAKLELIKDFLLFNKLARIVLALEKKFLILAINVMVWVKNNLEKR